MSGTDPLDERLWESGWDAHTIAQRRRMAQLTLTEKLDWLESAHALVLQLHGARAAGVPRDDLERRK